LNRRKLKINFNSRALTLDENYLARDLVNACSEQLAHSSAPLMICEPTIVRLAVAHNLAEQTKSMVAFLDLPQPGMPEAGLASYWDLIAGAIGESWSQLLCELPDELLGLPPSAQRLIGRLLVAQAGSAAAFAARLELGVARVGGEDSGTVEQTVVRCVSDAVAGQQTVRLSRSEIMTALRIRPATYPLSTLVLVRLRAERDAKMQAARLLSLVPALACEQVYLRLFPEPGLWRHLRAAEVTQLHWPTASLRAFADRLIQQAVSDSSAQYDQLQQETGRLLPLDELITCAEGSPTRLIQLLRESLYTPTSS